MTNGIASAQQYEWLVMLFLAGDNDIFKFGEILLEEATRVGSTDRVAIVAEQDPTNPKAQTKRGPLRNGVWNSREIGVTAGDPQTIVEFVQDSSALYPAKKRMLVLWDHGNGWQNVHVFKPVTQETGKQRLDEILEAVSGDGSEPINVLCFDSCLMAMIEIAYELRGKVEYIVASENIVPADTGWPYTSILGAMTMRPQITAGQVACAIVDGFSGSYNDSAQQPVTLSALRLQKVDDAVKAIDALARELLATCFDGGRQKVLFARRYAQSFGNPDYVDILSFCDELLRQGLGDAIDAAAKNVREQVGALILAPVHGSTPSVSAAHGLSIYFPDRPVSELYQKLEFAKPAVCMWSTFIRMLAPPLMPEKRLEARRGKSGKGQGSGRKKANVDATTFPVGKLPEFPVSPRGHGGNGEHRHPH